MPASLTSSELTCTCTPIYATTCEKSAWSRTLRYEFAACLVVWSLCQRSSSGFFFSLDQSFCSDSLFCSNSRLSVRAICVSGVLQLEMINGLRGASTVLGVLAFFATRYQLFRSCVLHVLCSCNFALLIYFLCRGKVVDYNALWFGSC